RPGQLDAAGLAPPADEHLGLDHDLAGSLVEEPLRRGDRLVHVRRDGPRRDRQALGDEEGLRVGFLDLPAGNALLGGADGRGGDGTASDRDGTIAGGRLANTAEARPRRSCHTRGAGCNESSWSGRGRAIMTPSPSWQAPRSPAWIPPPGSFSGTPIRPRTPCRPRSAGPGVICPRFGTRIDSPRASTNSSSGPVSMRPAGSVATASTSSSLR